MSFASPSPPRTVSRTRTVSSTAMLFLRLFFFFFVSLHKAAFGSLTIKTPQDLIDFSNYVNSGTSYSSTTLYLATDLDFNSSLSQQFHPIGNSISCYFEGTFDGQGHIIRNLNLSSTSGYVGLFGNSNGATIRNVVMDESCSFSSFSSNPNPDVGSVAGYCNSTSIENVVNMASVIFAGSKSVASLKIGGIVARLLSSSTVRNCVNYGPVTYSGSTSSSYSEVDIGGITGLCGGSSGNKIQNCANYGTLTHDGASTHLYIGGITGDNWAGANIAENCLSAGKIISATQGSTSNYIGGVVGYISSSTTSTATPTTNITHCLWTGDVGYNHAYGYKETSWTVTVTYSNLASLNATAMDEMNEYAEENSWDKWFILYLMGGTINSLTQDTLIVTQEHFPDPVKEGYTFWDWYLDEEYDEPYNPNVVSITTIAGLHARYTPNNYTVTFNFGNETIVSKNVLYGKKYGTLPDAGERAGWTFIGLFTSDDGSGDEITNESTVNIADDHVLYAHWTINNYTLRFILNNGESDVVKVLNYSDPIDYPNYPVKEEYSFCGWSENITTMPAHNLNITAQWTKVTEYVEIVFAKKDLSEDDVKTIIRKYTGDGDNFVIANIETVNGETKVIIKFADISKAEKFVEMISTSSNAKNNYITRIDFTHEQTESLSPLLNPISIFFSLSFE